MSKLCSLPRHDGKRSWGATIGRRQPVRYAVAFALFGLLIATEAACEKFQGTTDRALLSLRRNPCPEATPGRAAGAGSADAALECFQYATAQKSTDLMLRVTCRGHTPGACKQSETTVKEAERAMSDLAKLPWDHVLGHWGEASESKATDSKTITYAVDTYPSEKRVSTVTVCRNVEGDRWAVCDLGETPRETAQHKVKEN